MTCMLPRPQPNPFRGGVKLSGARAILPDAPGLGVEVAFAAHQKRHVRQ